MTEIKRTGIEPGDVSKYCSAGDHEHNREEKGIATALEKVAICVDGIADAVEDVNGTVKKHDVILRGNPEAPQDGLVTRTQVNSQGMALNRRLIFLLLTAVLGGAGTVVYIIVA